VCVCVRACVRACRWHIDTYRDRDRYIEIDVCVYIHEYTSTYFPIHPHVHEVIHICEYTYISKNHYHVRLCVRMCAFVCVYACVYRFRPRTSKSLRTFFSRNAPTTRKPRSAWPPSLPS